MTRPTGEQLPTGERLDARARRLMRSEKRVDLAAGGSYHLRKLSAGAITDAGELIAGIAQAADEGDEAVQRFVLTHLSEFLPLVAAAISREDGEEVALSPDDVAAMEFEDFIQLVMELDFGMQGGADVARRGFPADGGAASVGAGGSDDPHRA